MSLPTTAQESTQLAPASSRAAAGAETPVLYFLLSPDEVATKLETNREHGLTPGQIAPLQQRWGANELSAGGGVSAWRILGTQVCNAMILV